MSIYRDDTAPQMLPWLASCARYAANQLAGGTVFLLAVAFWPGVAMFVVHHWLAVPATADGYSENSQGIADDAQAALDSSIEHLKAEGAVAGVVEIRLA